MKEVDEKILWLAAFVCMPRWRAAARFAGDRMKKVAEFDAIERIHEAGSIPIADRNQLLFGFAERVRRLDPPLALAFELLALCTNDAAAVIHAAVADAVALLSIADGDTRQARARLRVWDDVARGKYDPATYGDDFFFQIADTHWRREIQRIVAPKDPMHPALQLLSHGRWDDAFGALHAASEGLLGLQRSQAMLDALRDRASVRTEIQETIEYLYALGTPAAGATALAWEMLTADPRKPHTFYFLTQLQFALDNANLEANEDAEVRERIRIWWRAAEGEWTDSAVSIFRIANVETRPTDDNIAEHDLQPHETSTAAALFTDAGLPTLVVMPASKATKLNNHNLPFKDIVGAALPLVLVRDVAKIRSVLHAEYPHATVAVDLALRDLREGQPVTLRPICLVGSAGTGKSRMVRRLGDLLRAFVYHYDGASSADSHFGGTSKAWGNTEASVPARAVLQSRSANPVVLVDELDKAAVRSQHGSLFQAMLPFLEIETASRYRDQSLDAQLNLSRVTYIATANDVTRLPAPLRDRFRIVKVPDPGLAHLPALAAGVMRDLEAEDESRAHDGPLAGDELDVIGRAWKKAGFSMRKLQAIVRATLEARDQYAPRHR